MDVTEAVVPNTVKSSADTFLTLSLKETIQLTELAFVTLAAPDGLSIAVMVGGSATGGGSVGGSVGVVSQSLHVKGIRAIRTFEKGVRPRML